MSRAVDDKVADDGGQGRTRWEARSQGPGDKSARPAEKHLAAGTGACSEEGRGKGRETSEA
ncbi:hypothetical protein TW86_20865 [Halomonas sp. S2151]|nr:hypothetical protein TW86_20865 [Halomonas sp. S2151]